MTIYCQHANRGKTQVLAVYRSGDDVVSSTVTSLDSPDLAAPVVEALNRISALATVPVSIFDERGRRIASYPTEHLAALTDRTARAELLSGAHSLWYESVCLELHQALADLDDALAAVPQPVRLAIGTELEREARELRDALADYTEAIPVPEGNRRSWDHERPFVPYGGGSPLLSTTAREQLDRKEEGLTAEQRADAVANLRVLVSAFEQSSAAEAGSGFFAVEYPEIFAEPYGADHLFLTVGVPEPDGEGAGAWHIEICRWEPDDPDEEGEDEYSSATGERVLECRLTTVPRPDDIADLLSRLGAEPGLLPEWAMTEVGDPLTGTKFVVTGVNR
ncbi:hypothetical protein [Streptomyces daliensis]|uniref:Uncharacterized protein n=1 Tax=Streptomyces daliensis TaxID=299421 RepID=A0A8T4IPH1_9ACTN|nr:hypothetical protein [Streptomyces daliensis]